MNCTYTLFIHASNYEFCRKFGVYLDFITDSLWHKMWDWLIMFIEIKTLHCAIIVELINLKS